MKKNLVLKLFSLIIGVLLSMIAYSQVNRTAVSIVVPVEVNNLPDHKVILLPSKLQAQVTLKGSSFLLSELFSNTPRFDFNLPEEITNNYKAPLDVRTLRLPAGVEVISIEPAELELVLDDLTTISVPIEVPRIGSLNDNLKVKKITLTPERVDVRGPSTEITTIKRIETEPLDMRQLSEDTTKDLLLRNPGKFTKPLLETVKARIDLNSIKAEKNFKKVFVEVRTTEDTNYKLTPNSVSLTVVGPNSVIKSLTKKDILPYIRLENQEVGTYRVRVKVELPEKLELASVSPESISVEISDSLK